MLTWLACRFAPVLPRLTDGPLPELPEPSLETDPLERVAATWRALDAVPFTPRGERNPYRVLFGMGCRDGATRRDNAVPGRAGTTPSYEGLPFAPVTIPLPDGPELTGVRSSSPPGAPTLIVVHGLFDSHVSAYVVEYAEALRRLGFHVVALDLRDHGRLLGQPPVASLGLGEGRDLYLAARALGREGGSVGILGLSYGGHCAVRAAHEATRAGEPEVLRGGVVALCAPLDVQAAVAAVDDPARLPRPRRWFDRLAHRHLLSIMSSQLMERSRAAGRATDPDEPYARYIRDVVLPAYKDGPQLVGAFLGHVRCTQRAVLGEVAAPVALLHGADDPLVPVEHLHTALAAAGGNPWVTGRELPAGGHCGQGAVDPEGTLAMLSAVFGGLRDG